MLLTLAAALSASACLFAASCAGNSFSRPNDRGAGGGDNPPATQAGEREESPKLYPVWLDGKTGFIDRTGKLVIPPRFRYSQFRLSENNAGSVFSEGMARIAVDSNDPPSRANMYGTFPNKYGYIDATGRIVVEPQYYQAEDFSEGLAAVLVGERWGYIDKKGRMVLGPKWIAAGSFSEGLAGVYEDADRRGYIDKTGSMVLQMPYYGINPFSEGLAPVAIDDDTQGFIDRTGRLIYKGKVASETTFSEGLAVVQVGDKWGFIDRTGRFALEPVYDTATPFHDGQATVATGGKYWFIDKSGKKVGECPPQSCDFHEGLATFESGGRWGYIDRAGRVVIKPKFSEAYDFSGGIAMVILPGKKMGYIDQTGRYVWPPSN